MFATICVTDKRRTHTKIAEKRISVFPKSVSIRYIPTEQEECHTEIDRGLPFRAHPFPESIFENIFRKAGKKLPKVLRGSIIVFLRLCYDFRNAFTSFAISPPCTRFYG